MYSKPQDGIDAAQGYIDYFYNKKDAHISEVTEIRKQYRQMREFFAKPLSSFAEFKSAGDDLNRELLYSSYEGVRKSWANLYGKEQERLLGPIMDNITEDLFDSFFKAQVMQLCEQEFLTWSVESVDRTNLSVPLLVSNGMAKQCDGEYLAHLRQTLLGVSFRTGVAKVSISGTIGPDNTGTPQFTRTRYNFLEKPIL